MHVAGGAPQQQPAWRQLAASLAAACSLDEVFTLQLRALCCWALQQPGQAPPLLVSGRVPLSAAYKELAREGRTPLLGVHLVSLPSRPTIQHLLATAQRAAAGSQQGSHLLDVLGFDVETAEASSGLLPRIGVLLSHPTKQPCRPWRDQASCFLEPLLPLAACSSPSCCRPTMGWAWRDPS